MKNLVNWPALLAITAAGVLFSGCSQAPQSPEVSRNIRQALDSAGLKQISITQDRDKGVVTLTGNVHGDADKAQAESIAKSIASDQVVSDQIAVLPIGGESDARAMNTDLDRGIEQNLDAALIQGQFHDTVKYTVKNHVVTLTGEVRSQAKRREAGEVAGSVPNVQQVVNELQVKNQKATSPQ